MKNFDLRYFLFGFILTLVSSLESSGQTKKDVVEHLTEQYSKYNKQKKAELKDSRGREIYTERLRRNQEYVVEVKRNGRVIKTDTLKLDRKWRENSKQLYKNTIKK